MRIYKVMIDNHQNIISCERKNKSDIIYTKTLFFDTYGMVVDEILLAGTIYYFDIDFDFVNNYISDIIKQIQIFVREDRLNDLLN